MQTIEPVRVSDHASFARGPSAHAADLLPVPMSHAALDVMCANVGRVQDRLRRPIAVENLSAYVQWRDAEMGEPEFLNTLAQRTGCQLLVDVNNIYVNALNAAAARRDHTTRWTDCRHWLDAIAPAHVAELHLAGHVHCGDIVIDDHGSRVVDAVWALYRHAVQRFGAVPTLIEWDTDVPELDVLLDEARSRPHSGPASAGTRGRSHEPCHRHRWRNSSRRCCRRCLCGPAPQTLRPPTRSCWAGSMRAARKPRAASPPTAPMAMRWPSARCSRPTR